MTRTARLALLAALSLGVAAPAFAQTIPPGQTCGGLLCDMGVFGRKVPVNADGSAPTQAQVAAAEAADPHRLPCHDFLCRAFGQKDAEAAPPPPPMPVAAAEPEAPAKHARKMKRKHLAKAEPRTAAPTEAAAPAAAK